MNNDIIVKSSRDEQLDMYRALAMIYIVCFIHVASWLHIVKEPLFSMMLFEMPVIFFIAGAAQLLSNKSKPFLQIVLSRFKRVVIPFYIYSVVTLLFLFILTLVWKYFYPQILTTFGENVANKYTYDIFSYSWRDALSIILCQDIPQAPIMWHTWFIVPYFLLSCLIWLQSKAARKFFFGGGTF